MVMPLPAHLRLPSPTAKPVASSVEQLHPRSPIKKHLQATAAASSTKDATTKKVGSPQKLKAAVAQSVGAVVDVTTPALTLETAVAEARGGRLRAATLQTVLGLLDRDDDALQHLLPLLQALGSLTLSNDSTRRQCMEMLQQLHDHDETHGSHAENAMTGSSPRTAGRSKAVSRLASSPRDSGRAKSAVSLQHCKEFLLACANEIHELEEVNPWFDYAEETNSEMAAVLARSSTTNLSPSSQRQRSVQKMKAVQVTHQGAVFDYESTVDSGSTIHTSRHGMDDDAEEEGSYEVDDTNASQGSQLTDLLCRAADIERDEEASDCGPRPALSLVDRVACRRVFRVWRGHSAGRASAVGRDAAVVSRAFAALKHNRAVSKLSHRRKQRAFQGLKSLVKPQSTLTKAVGSHKWARASSRLMVLLYTHWDLVVLLLIACSIHFVLQ